MSQTPSAQSDILVVDDTAANLQLLTGILKEKGYRVRPVPNGNLAIKAAMNNPPDLILLDINMPGMDGYEVCRHLKEVKKLQDIPVIFISAFTEIEDKVKAFEYGGTDYVTKPFRYEEVQARVATHIRLRLLQKESEQQHQQLKESYDRLREAEAMRDSLTHMIVHDIKSPLTSVSCCIDLLRSSGMERLNEKEQEYIEMVEQGADSILDMVDAMLDVSRFESGQMPLEIQECDLVAIVNDVLDTLKPQIQGHKMHNYMPDEAVVLQCDPEVIRRVMANLIENALHHTPETGEISVMVSLTDTHARVAVQDTGHGIPAAYHETIFEKFGQVDSRNQGHKHSTGLGLTFCKLAVEAHAGNIGVESEEGQGSTFWFVLPKEESKEDNR